MLILSYLILGSFEVEAEVEEKLSREEVAPQPPEKNSIFFLLNFSLLLNSLKLPSFKTGSDVRKGENNSWWNTKSLPLMCWWKIAVFCAELCFIRLKM